MPHRRPRPLLALAAPIAACALSCASFEATRLYERGSAALDRGDAAHAVADLERAAALAPGASSIQNHLGIAYERAGRDGDALQAYERAVALDCDNGAAQANLESLREGRSVRAR